jgi:polyisoprenoid-binding protein YceI
MQRTLAGALAAGFASLTLVAGTALAQAPAPRPQRPPPVSSKNPAATPAGTYAVNTPHTTVEARIGHANTFSYSTFRFGQVSGTLQWDPARIENSKLDVTVETGSLMTPVKGFAEELTGKGFLNSAQYPTAHFVSTKIQRTGPTTGRITGDFTLMGQTHPLTIDADLVGAGIGLAGTPAIGFTGTAKFKRSDFGFTAGAPVIADEVALVLDVEFEQPK